MKNYILLLFLLFVNLTFSQVIISDQMITDTGEKLDPEIEVYMNSVDKNTGLIVPYVDNNTSISNMKDGMFAYNTDKGCFVYYRDGWISSCLVDVKRDQAIAISYNNNAVSGNVVTSSYRLISASSTNTFTLNEKTLVKIIVSSSHQYGVNSGTSIRCASAQLGLFINNNEVKTVAHRSDASARGNIFPVSMTYIDLLPSGTYTITLKEKLNPTYPSCNTDYMNWYINSNINITYKSVP